MSAFAAAFTEDVVLDASVMPSSDNRDGSPTTRRAKQIEVLW
jgi:hypothetical protein